MPIKTLAVILAATTVLAAGFAVAAVQQDGSSQSALPPGHAAMIRDFGKLSADGARGYQDLTLARLAIYDGRVADAKKFVGEADTAFNKAKSAQSVFTEAEAKLRDEAASAGQQPEMTPRADGSDAAASNAKGADTTDVNKPIAWLPVDASVSINQDYTEQSAKVKAVADANKSLEKGDRKGALDTLKLAAVDTTVTLAVLPLQKTIVAVNEAKQMIDSGQYYEGSQKLRAVQNAAVYTIADIPGGPASGAQASSPAPATH